ncbi:MAG: VCBS repeat-containing protein [Myxococcota bacterium]
MAATGRIRILSSSVSVQDGPQPELVFPLSLATTPPKLIMDAEKDLGAVASGGDTTAEVTLMNQGVDPLNISKARLFGHEGYVVSIDEHAWTASHDANGVPQVISPAIQIAPGEPARIKVSYHAGGPEEAAAVLTLISNDPSAPAPAGSQLRVLVNKGIPVRPVVGIDAPDGAAGDVTCTVQKPPGFEHATYTYHWQKNGADWPGDTPVHHADEVRGCDLLTCFVELDFGGAEPMRSTPSDPYQAPLSADCPGFDPPIACRVARCKPTGGCELQPDVPVAGGTAVSCDDGDACTVDDACAVDGECRGTTARACDDGDPCTTNRCVAGACDYTQAAPATTPCDDGDPCTTNDKCSGGACSGTPHSCDDRIDCTLDSCGADGVCAHAPDDDLCDSGRCLASGCIDLPLSFGIMNGYATVAEANDIVVGDLDGDGDRDVAVAIGVDYSQGTPRQVATVQVFLNDGLGGLGTTRSVDGVALGQTVRLADVNNDGAVDLLEVGYEGLGVMLGLGDGQSFAPPLKTLTVNGEVDTSVAPADFDGDGNVDLAIGTTGSPPRVFTMRGRGDGTFESQVTLTDPTQQQRLAAIDLDEDGDLDLVSTATRDGLGVLLWRGDGAGHFQTPSSTPVADGLWGPITADLDHDGHLDIVSAAVDNDRLWTLLGDGHGGFTTKRSAVAATTPEQPAVGDFDGDGHLDAATAAAGSQAVLVFRGSASGALSFGLSIAVDASFPNNVAVADLDGDGRPDVLVTCRDRLAVYFNRTGCGGAGEAPCIH